MAYVLQVSDILEVSIVCNLLGQYSFNVLHFGVTARTGATVTDDHAALQMDSEIGSLYTDLLPTSCSYEGVKVQVISPDRWDPQFDVTSAGAGTLTGDCLPTQIAGLVAIKTGIAARFAQGRIYFPASSEGQNTSAAAPGTTYKTNIAVIMEELRNGVTVTGGGNTATLAFGVWSRKESQFFPMTEYFIRDDWATQRKRSHIRHDDASPF